MSDFYRDQIAAAGKRAEESLHRANFWAQHGLFELAAVYADSAESDSAIAFRLSADAA